MQVGITVYKLVILTQTCLNFLIVLVFTDEVSFEVSHVCMLLHDIPFDG